MSEHSVPLSQVLYELPLDEGRRIMRALRVGVKITCEQHTADWRPQYILAAEFGERTVRTLPYPRLGAAIINDLMTQLIPTLRPYLP